MNSRKNPRREFRRQYFAVLACDPKTRAENRLRCRRAHGHHQLWLNDSQLRFQPWAAGCDFARIRLLMNPAFPARLPLKMLYRVCDINLGPIDSGFFQSSIHDFPSGSHERLASDILVISRLLPDQHHRCAFRAFAEHGLRRTLVKVTRLTIFRRFAHGRPACRIGRLCRTGELFSIRSHVSIMNRNSRAIRIHYFQCQLSKLSD